MRFRPAPAAAFGALAVCGFALFDRWIGASSVAPAGVGVFRALFVVAGVLWGGSYGAEVGDRRATVRTLEAACWTAFVAFSAAVSTAILGSMLIEAALEMPRDPLGGILKLLMIVPFGPVLSILAVIFVSWILAPMALIVVLLVRRIESVNRPDPPPRREENL